MSFAKYLSFLGTSKQTLFFRGFAADLFVTGVKIEDMDGFEHLEPFIHTSTPILIVTSRADFRTFEMLRRVRYDGIYDGTFGWLSRTEGRWHVCSATTVAKPSESILSLDLLSITLSASEEVKPWKKSIFPRAHWIYWFCAS